MILSSEVARRVAAYDASTVTARELPRFFCRFCGYDNVREPGTRRVLAHWPKHAEGTCLPGMPPVPWCEGGILYPVALNGKALR